MSVRALRTDVYLATEPGAIATRFVAGTPADELPAGVADAIANPAAWVEYDEVVEAAQLDDPELVEVVEPVEPAAGDDEQDGSPAAAAVVEPPRSGRGATDAAWREFATALGQPVADDASRSDVIGQLSDAGLIDAEG